MDKNQHKSALKVNDGVEQPPAMNPNAMKRFAGKHRIKLSENQFVEGILNKDVSLLSQAITMIESSLPKHQEIAQKIIEKCLPYSGNSLRIGITGVPGVGKSTFIEALGKQITNSGRRLAVLAIDPSSERSRGSILGDKTRMEQLSVDVNAFIRPSPSAGSLGGVARKTRETIILCEAAGFDTIFIETVGVGQSETAVHSMVDFFLLLMLAGAGDELQGIKRGIMEMADTIAITKADGNNQNKAKLAAAEYKNALHLFPPTESGWIPQVLTCSALNAIGIEDVWKVIEDYNLKLTKNNFLHKNRNKQAKYWMFETINETLKNQFYNNPKIVDELKIIEAKILKEQISSFQGAKSLLDLFNKKM